MGRLLLRGEFVSSFSFFLAARSATDDDPEVDHLSLERPPRPVQRRGDVPHPRRRPRDVLRLRSQHRLALRLRDGYSKRPRGAAHRVPDAVEPPRRGDVPREPLHERGERELGLQPGAGLRPGGSPREYPSTSEVRFQTAPL